MSNFDTTKWFKNQYEKKAGLISEVKNLESYLENTIAEKNPLYSNLVLDLIVLRKRTKDDLKDLLQKYKKDGLEVSFYQDTLIDQFGNDVIYGLSEIKEANNAELNVNTTDSDRGSGDADNPEGEELEAKGGGFNE
tara:strand:- start:1726 stop:2133 length:408 start_codon:yes stop_codon:yes gene_type:complete